MKPINLEKNWRKKHPKNRMFNLYNCLYRHSMMTIRFFYHAVHPRHIPQVGEWSNFFVSWDYLTRVNRFFESRDTNISETILLVKCYTKLAQLLMDVVGSVAKFSRKENGSKGGRRHKREVYFPEKEDRSPKDKEESFSVAACDSL